MFEYALTPQQRRIWAASTTPTSRFNAAFRVEIAGPLSDDILRQTIAQLVDRHEALRSSCAAATIAPAISVHDTDAAAVRDAIADCFKVTDLRGLHDANKIREIELISARESRVVFDLQKPASFRFHLLRLHDNLSILTMTFHQMFMDGWSTEIIIKEITERYATLENGVEADLPPPALQAADYAEWLNAHLAEPEVVAQAHSMLSELDNYGRFDVKPNRKTEANSDTSHIIAREIPSDTADALTAATKSSGRTPFSIAASACIAALHRLTEQADIVIGAPMSGRNSQDIEQIVGATVDTVLLRVPVTPMSTFAQLQDLIALKTADALARPALPLEFLCDLARKRGVDIPEPVYSVGFLCQHAFGGALKSVVKFGKCSLRTLPSISSGPLHDLFFFLVQRETGWRAALEYNAEKFADAEARSYLEAFDRMFVAAIRAPETQIATVAIPDPTNERPPTPANSELIVETGDSPLQFPASVTQSRFYHLTQLLPGSAAFNMPACMDIRGPLNIEALRKSLRILSDQHEALRTSFRETDGIVHQVIGHETTLDLIVQPLLQATPEVAIRTMTIEGRRPFNGLETPPVRAQLLQLAADHNILVLTAHHIIADAHSLGLIEKDLWTTYAHFLATGAMSEVPPAIQYLDYSAAQSAWLADAAAAAQRAFWLEKLKGPLPVADIPIAAHIEPGQQNATTVLIRAIPASVEQKLQRFCATRALTAYQVTAAAFTATIADISGNRDILFGSPIANRSDDTQGVVGPLSGILPMRMNLAGCSTLEDVVQRSCDTAADCLEHAQYPFDLLLDDLDAPSRNGRSPLFQLFFMYQNAYMTTVEVSDLVISPCKPVSIDAPHELKFGVIRRQQTLELHVEYQKQLFADHTISAYIEQFLKTLADILDGKTDQPIHFRTTQQQPISTPRVAPVQASDTARSPVEQFVIDQFELVLRQKNVSRTANFFDCGGQSIGAVRLFQAIYRHYGVSLPISALLRHATPAALASQIEAAKAAKSGNDSVEPTFRFLVPIRERNSTTQASIFICAGAGGNVLNLRDLADAMSDHVQVVGLQARGLTADAEPHTSFEEMAQDFLQEVRRYQPKGPYYFGGYSAGGVAAYEMARQLTAAGEHVELVVLFDTIPPVSPKLSFADKLKWRATNIQTKGLSSIVEIGTNRLWRDIDRLKEVVGKAPRTDVEKRIEEAIRQCYQVYTLQPYDGRVLLLRPPLEVDCTLDDGRAIAADGTIVRLDNYWQDFAQNLSIRVVADGNHFDFIEGPNAASVATAIAAELKREGARSQSANNQPHRTTPVT